MYRELNKIKGQVFKFNNKCYKFKENIENVIKEKN